MSTTLPPLEFDFGADAVPAPVPTPRRTGAPTLRRHPPGRLRRRSPGLLDEDVSTGCGWFDSSRDLADGLEVREHGGAEGLAALGAQLPPHWWLQWELEAMAADDAASFA
jgi:hypothetical protein